MGITPNELQVMTLSPGGFLTWRRHEQFRACGLSGTDALGLVDRGMKLGHYTRGSTYYSFMFTFIHIHIIVFVIIMLAPLIIVGIMRLVFSMYS